MYVFQSFMPTDESDWTIDATACMLRKSIKVVKPNEHHAQTSESQVNSERNQHDKQQQIPQTRKHPRKGVKT